MKTVVANLEGGDGPVVLSGLKNQVRKLQPDFSEKTYGYGSFLQFTRAAANEGLVTLEWSGDSDDYVLTASPI